MTRLVLVASFAASACFGVYGDPQHDPSLGHEVAGPRIVFVTSDEYLGGELGGLAGADAKCAAHAVSAGLAGTYRAWLSDSTSSAGDRLTHATGAYELVNGQPVTSSWDALVAYGADRAINLDERGQLHVGTTAARCTGVTAPVWTGTMIDGTYGGTNSCGNWVIIQDATGPNGSIGDANEGGSHWTDARCAPDCTQGEPAALYCLEQ